jgi:hypothetical protein
MAIAVPGVPEMISAERTYAMLGNETLWETAKTCHEILAKAGIPHAILGGVAVCLHGYQRNTVDAALLVQPGQADKIRKLFATAGIAWNDEEQEFRTPTGIAVQFVVAGERAGRNSDVRLPDPAEEAVVTQLEGLPVLSLAALIESKIACGEANLRRTHKDFADVVELIARHDLGREFARHLHKSLRPTFRKLVAHGRAE